MYQKAGRRDRPRSLGYGTINPRYFGGVDLVRREWHMAGQDGFKQCKVCHGRGYAPFLFQ